MSCAIAQTPTPNSTADRGALSTAAPTIAEARGSSGECVEAGQHQEPGSLFGERGDDGQTLGRVVQGEPNDESGAEGEFAGGCQAARKPAFDT